MLEHPWKFKGWVKANYRLLIFHEGKAEAQEFASITCDLLTTLTTTCIISYAKAKELNPIQKAKTHTI